MFRKMKILVSQFFNIKFILCEYVLLFTKKIVVWNLSNNDDYRLYDYRL